MHIETTSIDGLLIITPDVFGDDRGFFCETYHKSRYEEVGVVESFVQDNLSKSARGVLRGLHFQRQPHAQGKLVSVPFGCVWDVAVDIRKDSPTFGKWFGVELSAENHKQFWIPAGFAHGFVALQDDTLFSYKCTDVYAKECEGGIFWNDPDLDITWPIDASEAIVSEKDQALPNWKKAFV
jgi:dTDP-4-dehydrorhamnose 3,5-epimerase